MIEPTRAAAAATDAASTGGTPAAKAALKGSRSFASVLAKSANSGSSSGSGTATTDTTTATTTSKAAERPDGEQTKKIAGHPYARIINGEDKGLYLNQLASSPRLGKTFKLLERDDHVFHVYGSGKDRVIVEVKHASTTDKQTTTGGTTTTGTTSSPTALVDPATPVTADATYNPSSSAGSTTAS